MAMHLLEELLMHSDSQSMEKDLSIQISSVRLKELHQVLLQENQLIHHFRQVLRLLMPWYQSEEDKESLLSVTVRQERQLLLLIQLSTRKVRT